MPTPAVSWLRLRQPSTLLCLSAAVLLSACSRPAPPEEPIRAVKLMTVGIGALAAQPEYAGESRARVESRLGFRVGGKIVQRQAELGQRVRAGEVLAQLDPRDYQLAADASRAQLAAATTQRDLAAADFKRYQVLKDQNFISGAELDRREANVKAAQASLDQARAQLSAQGNQAQYTRLVADVSGVVTAVDAEPGQVVAAGTPVVRIAQDGVRDGVFSVPEDRVAHLTMGSEVAVRVLTSDARLTGRVREVAASADPVTRTYLVKVALEGSEQPALGASLYFTPKALSTAGMAAIKLPTTALRQEGAGTAVWVYDPATSTVQSQAIQIATADGNEVVVAGGLKPGMQVVSTGVHVLAPGQKVMIYKPKGTVSHVNQGHSATDLEAGAASSSAASVASTASGSVPAPSAAASAAN